MPNGNGKAIGWAQAIQAVIVGITITACLSLGSVVVDNYKARIKGSRCTGETCEEMQNQIRDTETWREWHNEAEQRILADILELQHRVERLDDEVWPNRNKPPLPDHYTPGH